MDEWIIADIAGETATFALTTRGTKAQLREVTTYETSRFPTLTDCVTSFAKDKGIELRGRQIALSVSGAITGDVLRIVHCRWIISISGLRHLTGVVPLVTNDSVALAWSSLVQAPHALRPLSDALRPDLTKPGRWLTINRRSGVGAAILVLSEGGHVSDSASEIGHIAFSPQTEGEHALAAVLRRSSARVSWEMALLAMVVPPAEWAEARPEVSRMPTMHAEMLGAFVGDAILAMAAWGGAFIHGSVVQLLARPECAAAFNRRFEDKGFYASSVRATPRWIVNDPNASLAGAARMLAQRNGESLPQ